MRKHIREKIIALTGGTGFVGRAVLQGLIKAGHRVVALHRRTELIGLPKYEGVTWASQCELEEDLLARRYDAVIQLATVYGHGLRYSEVIESNIKLPMRLLECAATGGCSFFVNTDTFFTKPTFDYPHMRPYTQSKMELLDWLTMASETMPEIKIINARLEHVYGVGDSIQKFVPQVLNKLIANEHFDLTPGEQVRDFIHLQDVVSAYMTIINAANCLPKGMSEIEIGTGSASSVRDFVEIARMLSNSKSVINFGALPYRDREIMNSVGNTKVLIQMGWTPQLKLHQGIKLTLEGMAI